MIQEDNNAQPIVSAMVSIDYKSYKAFRKDTQGHWWLKSLIWVVVAIPLVLLLAYSVSSYLADVFELIVNRDKCFWMIFYIFSIWPAGVLHVTVFALITQRPKKIFQKSKAILELEKQYAFYEGYHTMQKPYIYYMVEYASYTEAKEYKIAFYLKLPEGTYVQLPKKCFTEDQIAALRELFERKFGKQFKQYKKK